MTAGQLENLNVLDMELGTCEMSITKNSGFMAILEIMKNYCTILQLAG